MKEELPSAYRYDHRIPKEDILWLLLEAKGEDFSNLNKRAMNMRPSTEGGTSVVYRYSDSNGTKYMIHEVTDGKGNVIHRDFDAVRIPSGQIINKGH